MEPLTLDEINRYEPLAMQREVETNRQMFRDLVAAYGGRPPKDAVIFEEAATDIAVCCARYRVLLTLSDDQPALLAEVLANAEYRAWFEDEFPTYMRGLVAEGA